MTDQITTIDIAVDEPTEDVVEAPVDLSPIEGFKRPYDFLSNTSAFPIVIDNIYYMTAEHAFQAHRVLSPKKREIVALSPTPEQARLLGQRLPLRDDWEEVKDEVMRKILEVKFSSNQLRPALIQLADRQIINSNTSHDQYWGDCTCHSHESVPGENRLGKMLMSLRDDLIAAADNPPEPEYIDDGTFTDVEPDVEL